MKLNTFKHLLLTLMLMIFVPASVVAQSMSDEQVIRFVKEQQKAGTEQKMIVQKLLQRGVTTGQLQRIRKKYAAEQSQLGASDLTGGKSVDDRTRKNDFKQEQASGKIGNLTKQQNLNTRPNPEDRLFAEDEMTDALSFMTTDSLAYYQALYMQEINKKKIFGHNIFNNEMLSFEPNMNIATPSNYILGAGDNVIIDVWGASQQTFNGIVSPDGTVTIEGVGPIKIGGMSISQASSAIKSRLGTVYRDSQVQLTLGNTRSILVHVMGEVEVPGSYTLSALSTSFNALYAAGGINEIGTLRNIKVYRNGRSVATIDVYDYILNGNAKGDVRLQEGDIIVVGPYECLVDMEGKVKRPMFYEMKSSESVATIINYAGGFAGDAYRKSVRIVRKNGAEYSIHTVGEFDMANFSLCDGDSVYVDSVVPRYSNMVEIKGAVMHPGMFQVDGSISTVRELINAAEGLREDAFVSRAVMHRQREDLSLEVLPVDIVGIMNGSQADIPLRKNDVLFIASKQDMLGDRTLKISGEVRYPGIYVYADNSSVEDLIIQAGGMTEAGSLAKVDVFRRLDKKYNVEGTKEMAEQFTFSLKDGFVIEGESSFKLQPFDEVVVRKNPSYMVQQTVSIGGSITFPGDYTKTNREYRLSDLIKSAGGLMSNAYTKGARVDRIMNEDEQAMRASQLKMAQINLNRNTLNADMEKMLNFDVADSLMWERLEAEKKFSIPVNLEQALKEPGSDADIILREGDYIYIPEYSSVVKIQGEVTMPAVTNFAKGESLNYYIKRGGGYTDKARKSRVYAIYANGAVEQLSHNSRKAIQPGCTIVVPAKNKQKPTITEYAAIGTSAASISTMLVTIANLLK